jgi:hypothetical protein
LTRGYYTGAIVALIDRDDAHHETLLALFKEDPHRWLLPWAILPEVDYLLASYVGVQTERAFVSDVASGSFRTDWGADEDLRRADALNLLYGDLKLGLVDTIVMAIAERTRSRPRMSDTSAPWFSRVRPDCFPERREFFREILVVQAIIFSTVAVTGPLFTRN